MAKAIEEIRVLDLAQVLVGPFCSYRFTLLGGAPFLAQNCGASSLALHLKNAALAVKSVAEWETVRSEIDIPSGRVSHMPEILHPPQTQPQQLLAHFAEVPDTNRCINGVYVGLKMEGSDPDITAPPPCLSEHTDAILTELGDSYAEIPLFHVIKGDLAHENSRRIGQGGIRMVDDRNYRHQTGRNRHTRLPDSRFDRHIELPANDLVDAAREFAQR